VTDEFDVVVLGGGPAGEVAAGRCAEHGLSVVLVERELVGGECTYWACIPSKTLIRPGDVIAAAQRAPGAAEAVTGALDAEKAFAQRDYMTSDWSDEGQEKWLADTGVELVRGEGRLDGERAVSVGDRRLVARKAVILATGSDPVLPRIDGLDPDDAWGSREATSAHEVPASMVVLGGGTVGVELAQAYRRLGSERVTVVQRGPRLLPREEPFAGEEVVEAFREEGIEVLLETRAATVSRSDGETTVRFEEGGERSGERLLVAIGRRPRTREIGLESVGIDSGKPVAVDDQLRARGAAGGWLYAIGDVNGVALLTHMGKYQGRLAADHIAGREVDALANRIAVPRVTFTDPQVAGVGLTEAQARERGLDLRTVSVGTGDVAGAYTQGNGVKGTSFLVVDEARRVVVGATFTGPGISELLFSATVAVAGEVPLDRLWHAVPAFPTVSEVWLRLLEAYGL
jgi:dihydrolipoamide dehydrogenase